MNETQLLRDALSEAYMLMLPIPAPEVTALELAKHVSERALSIVKLLERATTSTPPNMEADAVICHECGSPCIIAEVCETKPPFQTVRTTHHCTRGCDAKLPDVPVQRREESERTAFEVWAALRWLPLNRNEIGGASYQNGDTDLAWRAWQARAADTPIGRTSSEMEEWQVRYIFEGGFKEEWRTVHATKLNDTPKATAESLASMKRSDGRPMYEVRLVRFFSHPTAAEQPQAPEQGAIEVVAWALLCAGKPCMASLGKPSLRGHRGDWSVRPLTYADAPPAPKLEPMTRQQINKASGDAQIAFCLDKAPTYEVALVREVEAHHGISTKGVGE